jgi:hypothetical protein
VRTVGKIGTTEDGQYLFDGRIFESFVEARRELSEARNAKREERRELQRERANERG